MGILKSPRERDLAEAAELREAVRQFEQENDRPTIEKYRRMFEPLLERAELLERRHGVVPGGSAAVLDRAAGPVANSVSGALTTQRERDLAQAADLRRAAAEQEKRDPEAAVKNRVFFEDMLRMAEELERKHGQPAASVNVAGSIPAAPVAHSSPLKNVEQPPPAVSPRAGYGFQGRSSTGEGACATGQALFQRADRASLPPLAFDVANAQDLNARLHVVVEAVKQGRIIDTPESRTYWLLTLRKDPEAALYALNHRPVELFNSFSDTIGAASSPQSGMVDAQRQVCKQLGLSEEQFRAAQRK